MNCSNYCHVDHVFLNKQPDWPFSLPAWIKVIEREVFSSNRQTTAKMSLKQTIHTAK